MILADSSHLSSPELNTPFSSKRLMFPGVTVNDALAVLLGTGEEAIAETKC